MDDRDTIRAKGKQLKLGYVKGETFIKRKEVRFNPNSRKHIEFCLKQKYGWKPKDFTPSGDAKIDETILNALPYPEAKKLAHSFLVQKRIGMLAEGNSAWMKLAKDDPQSPRYGLLRHTINPNGTVTGRASHFGPNLAQVPATRAPYGKSAGNCSRCRRATAWSALTSVASNFDAWRTS